MVPEPPLGSVPPENSCRKFRPQSLFSVIENSHFDVMDDHYWRLVKSQSILHFG